MKKLFLFFSLAVCLYQHTLSQNIGINATGAAPNASAMLDISSADKGLLIPRIALTATDAAAPVSSPAIGLLVYNTATAGVAPNNVAPGFYYWNGSAWTSIANGGAGWSMTGNTGTDPSVHFIGTTDPADLVLSTNNTEAIRIASDGSVGIGSSDFDGEKVLIDAGDDVNTALSIVGNINDYMEMNVQNRSNGNKASSDIVATANNGTGSSVYVDMGINSQAYANGVSNVLNGPNLAYLYSNARDFKIGNGAPGYDLMFFTNPTGGPVSTITANGQERMRISQSGNVGIGTSTPNSTLSVGGSLTMPYRTGNTAYTITASDHVVIHTGSSPRTWTLPAANTCPGRIYRLVNHATADITLSQTVRTSGSESTTTLTFTPGSNVMQIISDGTTWVKIN